MARDAAAADEPNAFMTTENATGAPDTVGPEPLDLGLALELLDYAAPLVGL